MLTCKNCNSEFEGNYCNHCGQKNYTEKDKSIKHIFGDAFQFLTNFEGSFFTTLKAVLLQPSVLTIDYCNGKRKKYFKPISFFFLVVVVYLLFPIFKGLNMEMSDYEYIPFLRQIVSEQITEKSNELNITIEEIAQKFDSKSKVTSKICLFLFIPLSVILIHLLYFTKKKLLFDTIILATEINIFFLLALFLLFPLVYYGIGIALKSLWDIRLDFLSDITVSATLTFAFAFYCSYIFKQFFGESRILSILKGILFTLLHSLFLMILYRFIVFELVFIQM
jgi:hypothetical protein